ncbi:hypothetical protein DID77_00695 [Candidatus Marinamargulisbacteria bacterium SCGC AG-439-L15]|nr:hypothetical protein DID77_00695 [Candidatus Marinamargulisbacteria bacterium SCGC AG-439-L15]
MRASENFGPMAYDCMAGALCGTPLSKLSIPEWNNQPICELNAPLISNMKAHSVEILVNGIPVGMGVWVNNHILTARHVIENREEVSIQFSNGQVLMSSDSILDKQYDMALLKVNEKNPLSSTHIHFTQNPIGRYACLYNNEGESVVSSGDIANEAMYARSEFLIDIPLNPGASGAGVFDLEGRCVGLMIYHLKEARYVRQFIPFSQVKGLLESADVKTADPSLFLMPQSGIGVLDANGELGIGDGEYEFDKKYVINLAERIAASSFNTVDDIDDFVSFIANYQGCYQSMDQSELNYPLVASFVEDLQNIRSQDMPTFKARLGTSLTDLKSQSIETKNAGKDFKTIIKEAGFKKEKYRHATDGAENQGHKPPNGSLHVKSIDTDLAVSIDKSDNCKGDTVKAFYKGFFIGTYGQKKSDLAFLKHGKEDETIRGNNSKCAQNRRRFPGNVYLQKLTS